MKRITFFKSLLVAAGLLTGASAWADDWSTVWSADFSSVPTGVSYSISRGANNISNGYLLYYSNDGSGDRTTTLSFNDAAFNVSTNWKMDFDWNAGSANTNSSRVTFATDQGDAFTITWAKSSSTATVTDASGTELTTTLPHLGYNKGTCSSWSHITITGNTDDGVYLTITNGTTTYVDNVLVTGTYGYPKSFNGVCGKNVGSMFIDNITFATPKVAGYVAPPTGTVVAPDGTARKFTLACLTDGATIYYAESDLEIGAAGWNTYTAGTQVTTSAATIYMYASDGVYNSEKASFATGAGTAITLNAPTITLSGVAQSGSVYYPVVTVVSNQSGLELTPASPVLSYTFNGGSVSASSPYTFTGTGTLTVTVEAGGFTSNSASYVVSNSFVKTKTVDLAAITAGDLSAVWTKQSDGSQLPNANWQSRYSDASFPLYVYNYASDDAVNTDVVEGLIVGISGKDADPGVTPQMYVGAGLLLPTKRLNKADWSESDTWNTSINVSVNGGTAEQIAVYTYPTNYGQSTSTKAVAADQNFGLYRYSDMLTKVEVYSPATSVPVTANAFGYQTFASDYPLDFTSTTTKAYIATGESAGKVTMTKVTKVPANTGLLLQCAADEEIPVLTVAAEDVAANKFVRGTGAAVATGTTTNRYVLGAEGESVAFFQIDTTPATVSTSQAYLEVAATSARLAITFDDETTGINNVNVNHNDDWYDLQGRRVAAPQKGLYIVNGKKVVIK